MYILVQNIFQRYKNVYTNCGLLYCDATRRYVAIERLSLLNHDA